MLQPTSRAPRLTGGRPASPGSAAPDSAASSGATSDDGVASLQDVFDREHARQVESEALLQVQRAQYDFASEERTELEREFNDTRTMILAQMKQDDEIVKKFIELM